MRWKEYKKLKEEWYLKYIHKNKLKKCSACNGSGFYDHSFPHNRNPKCGCCDGTGKVRERKIVPFGLIHFRQKIQD